MQTKREVVEPYNNFKHVIEVKKVGERVLMLSEIEYDDKKQQGVKLYVNNYQEEQQHC
jgi:hypothetical protein